MTIPAELPAPVARFLGEFVGRSRRLRLIRGAGIAIGVFIGWAMVCCTVDRFAHLSSTMRAVLLTIGTATSLMLIIRAAVLSQRRPNWVAVAIAAERVNPRFAQKLVTVTSQSLARPDQRGSDQILAQLVNDVTSGIRSKEPTRAPGAKAAILPWLLTLVLTVVWGTLLDVPSLHGSQLAMRYLQPFADIPPVTTTQLRVSPGDVSVVQSQPLNIRVDADNIGDTPPNLLVQSGGQTWTTLPMTAGGDGSFLATIASVDRDQRYAVVGGDARSPEFQVRVLRRPAIAQFDMLYEYPAYTRLKPAVFHNDDGRIEAPTGSRVTLTVTSTEPLTQALLVRGSERLPMALSEAGTSAQLQLTAQTNQEYSIELVSDRGVSGGTAAPGTIRVLPDLPPQVRVLRGGDSLRLNPRDFVPVSYDALDDYGLVSLSLQADVNGSLATTIPLRLAGEVRRQQDTYAFDLANQQVAYGDVLTLTLVATDTGGHEVRAMPLQALIMPRVVNMDSYQRTLELQHAIQLQEDLLSQLNRAAALTRVAATQPSHPSGGGRFDREVTGAIQSSALLKQSLLRAITHAEEPAFSTLVADWIDSNESVVNSLQDLFRRRGRATARQLESGALREPMDVVGRLGQQMNAILRLELASALQKDLENVAATRARPVEKEESARQRATLTLDRMEQEVSEEARQLGLSSSTPNLPHKIEDIVASGNRLLNESKPVSFRSAIEMWSRSLRIETARRPGLESRLTAAAQAEALRPDADLVRARDLELAGRAVVATRANSAVDASGIAAIADAIRMLVDRTGRLGGLHPTTLPARELMTLAAARTVLRRAANERDDHVAEDDAPVEGQRDLESLAIAASAASASRQYERASDLESQMYRRLRTRNRHDRNPNAKSQPADDALGMLPDRIERRREAAQRESDAAKRLDDIDRRQQLLAQSTEATPDEQAKRQRSVADELATIGQADGQNGTATADGRDRATAEVMAGIELLAAMPQTLADAQNAAISRRAATRRAISDRKAAAGAPAGQRHVLQRVAQGADQSEAEAADRYTRAAAPLAPVKVQLLAQRLGAFAPETDAARDLMQVRLEPVLADLQDSLAGDDTIDTDRVAADVLDAISAAQRELLASRDLLMRRDPLAAARSFARLAADALAASPPNVAGAKRQQAGVFESLSRAWDQSIHRAAQQRLASIPSMAAVLGSPLAGESDATLRPADRFSNARQWDRMRGEDDAALDAKLHESEPAGYEEPLKLYFEALGRGQSGQPAQEGK